MSMRLVSSTGIVSGLAALTVAVLAFPASAVDVSCGDVLLTDTKLTRDLNCGPGDGLVIGTDGITLDLKGHTITGPGAYGAGAGGGVRAAQVSGFEIRNGTITGYAEAVVLDEAWNGHVWGLVLTGNDRGVNLAGGGGHLIEKNTISDNGRDAVRLGLSRGSVIQKNVVTDNVFGIGVTDGSSDNVVTKNTVLRTRADGIWVGIATGTDISKNETDANGDDGIDVDAVSTTIVKNSARGNGDLGIEAVPGVTDGGGNLASANGNPAQCIGVVCEPAD